MRLLRGEPGLAWNAQPGLDRVSIVDALHKVPYSICQKNQKKAINDFNLAPLSFALVGGVMLGAAGDRRRSSSLSGWKRRLLGAVALSALPLPGWLTSPGPAWSHVSETLPEVTVTAPRPAHRPPRRAEPATRRAAPSPPERPEPAPAPAPAVSVSAPSPFQFVAPTPITGLGIDRDKVPAMVQTLPAADFSRDYSPNVVETFVQRIPGVTTNNVQGNEFATDLRYRGFAASPLQGTPQGLAVYMQGIRVNEAFGDTVNWDLIPKVAIGRSDIWTNNPAFGLNALGGAISFQMKDGFTYSGTEFDASGGSYGRVGGSLQYGVRNGEWGLYLAAEGLKDDGWRYQSPSRLARFYGDLGWKGTEAEIHLVTSAADNFFGVIGPTPIELLANDYRAIYTWPQTTKNQAALVALNGRYSVTDHWTVQSNLYYRRFNQQHVDGNAAEIERCSGAANNPLFNTLCLENDAFPQPRPPAAGFQILNQNGQPIPCPPGSGNTCATTPWGTVDRTFTKGLTTGASLQGLNDDKVLGHDNYFVIGASVDRSKIGFLGNSELGFIYPDLFIGPNAAIPGTGQIIHTAADIGFSPVSLAAWQTYYGAYFNETFDLTNRLSVTAGARYNLTAIDMADLFGTSTDLSASYPYARFNPVTTTSRATAFLLGQQYMPSCLSALGYCLHGMSRSQDDRWTIRLPSISRISSGIRQR